jgi:nucleoside-triphosphatase THEP1
VEPTIGLEGRIRIVTGEWGSGKSTLCRRVAAEARAYGLAVAGVLTEESGLGGAATRRVTDLRSTESRHFGTQSKSVSGAKDTGAPVSDPLTPSWLYDEGVFRWGNNVLARSTPCDLLVVDELGPLEILGDRGWFTAFEVLRRRQFGTALVVCRPALVGNLQERVGEARAVTYHVTHDSRDALPAAILGSLFPGRPLR